MMQCWVQFPVSTCIFPSNLVKEAKDVIHKQVDSHAERRLNKRQATANLILTASILKTSVKTIALMIRKDVAISLCSKEAWNVCRQILISYGFDINFTSLFVDYRLRLCPTKISATRKPTSIKIRLVGLRVGRHRGTGTK
jgi:hypothetical protein